MHATQMADNPLLLWFEELCGPCKNIILPPKGKSIGSSAPEFVSYLYWPTPIGFEGGERGMTTGRSYHSLLPELSSTLHTHTHPHTVCEHIIHTYTTHMYTHMTTYMCTRVPHTHTPHEQTICTFTTQWHMCTDTAGNIKCTHASLHTIHAHSIWAYHMHMQHPIHTCVHTTNSTHMHTCTVYTVYTHTHARALWALYWGIRTASLWCAPSRNTVQLFPSSAFFPDPEPCPGMWSWRGYDPRMESEALRSLLPDSGHRTGLSSLCWRALLPWNKARVCGELKSQASDSAVRVSFLVPDGFRKPPSLPSFGSIFWGTQGKGSL